MIWIIVQKEIRENVLSLRFALLFLLAIVFIPSSLYTNYRAYLARLGDQQQIEKNNLDYLHKLQVTQVFTSSNFTVDVYWPPSPASVFASGFEGIHPRHLVIGKNSVEYGAPLEAPSSLGLVGSLDYLFVVQFIFSLFAVLLSFDAITREKENGTLRSILSNPLSRPALATGKLLGGYVTLAIPLLTSFLIGMLILEAAGLDVFARDFIGRAAWMLAASLLYIAVFFLLGLLVSSLVSSTYAALVISLAFWLSAVLVLPRAGSLAAQLWKPVKSRQVTWLEKVALDNSFEMDKGRAVLAESEKNMVLDEEGRKVSSDDWPQKRAEIAAPFEERAAQGLRKIEQDYRRRKSEQRGLGLFLARLSPAGAFLNFATEMSGTGIQGEERFMSDADRYQETLQRELFSKFYRDVYPGGGVSMGTVGFDMRHLPEFKMARIRARDSVRGEDLAILLCWFAAIAVATYIALARYDVR